MSLSLFFFGSQVLARVVPSVHTSGQLLEVFGTGTAAVISPVNGIKYREHDIEVSGGWGWVEDTSVAPSGLMDKMKIP